MVEDLGAAADSAGRLEKVLTDLLEFPPVLSVLEKVIVNGDGPAAAVVRMPNGPRVSLPIHPAVDIEALRNLRKWECVLVSQKEMLVVGTWADDDYLWSQAQGEVVEFRSYYAGRKDMAWVTPQGPTRRL